MPSSPGQHFDARFTSDLLEDGEERKVWVDPHPPVYKPNPSDACESQSGECPKNAMGPHYWRFGKCTECGLGEGYGKLGLFGGSGKSPVRRTCPTCEFSWRDTYRHSKCPKCVSPLNVPESKKYRLKPVDACESTSDVECPKGGFHSWKFGKCRNCGIGQGYGEIGEKAGGNDNPPIKKQCPTCAFNWIDKYRKNECPKCNCLLTAPPKRAPGEVSTHKKKPGDALESQSGECSRGGAHAWKFGRCNKCGVGEGYASLGANGGCYNYEVKKRCPTCSYSWLDKYRRNECPKCLFPLVIWDRSPELDYLGTLSYFEEDGASVRSSPDGSDTSRRLFSARSSRATSRSARTTPRPFSARSSLTTPVRPFSTAAC
uniref:Uncharacterized protein n=1 Tax=Pyramimonas obovata TaxID=1411642 RepID=A0A7S0QX86_9CHLO|mmetsp:Transcript_16347/g.35532  ORF Transcript_16347/g.35532 Transcript_16347/m.35532 type:complete len:372 (+) Transcript_16347:159-1274(+)